MLACDSPLACGICSVVFHQRCTNLKRPAAKLIADYEGIFFKCDNCTSNDNRCARDGSLDIGDLKKEMEKLTSISDSLVDVARNIEAQINIALEKGIEKLIGSFNEVLRDNLVCIENSVAKKLEDLKSSVIENLTRENKLSVIYRKRTMHDASVHSKSE